MPNMWASKRSSGFNHLLNGKSHIIRDFKRQHRKTIGDEMLVMSLSFAGAVRTAVVVSEPLKRVSLERRKAISMRDLRRNPRVTEGSGEAISDYVVIDMIKVMIR